MSGEIIEVRAASAIVLEGSGSALANGAVGVMTSGRYAKQSAGNGFPDAQFALTCQFSVAPIKNSFIAVYARPMAVDGSNNTQAPEATRPTRFIGQFVVNDVTAQQTMEFMANDLPWDAWYYLHNVNTGQQLPVGWAVSITPRTFKAAP